MERPKIFFIGKNKTATTSLHIMFKRSGYRSVHCIAKEGGHIGKRMYDNIEAQREILWGMETQDVFSDLLYAKKKLFFDGAEHFKKLYAEYPDAYFVLQTRDTDSWIKSRTKHKKGEFIKRLMTMQRVKTKLEMQDIWREEKETHEQKVREFFALAKNAKFLEYDINKHNIQILMDWVKPDYPNLMRKNYGWRNKTSS